MNRLVQWLESHADLDRVPLASALVPVVSFETQVSSSGWPYLSERAYLQLRDRVPHVLGYGHLAWEGLEHLAALVSECEFLSATELHHFQASRKVVAQVLKTAAITAPPSLWLARHVLSNLVDQGIAERLLDGEGIRPGREPGIRAEELEIDLTFLSILGLLHRERGLFSLAETGRGQGALSLPALPSRTPVAMAGVWGRFFEKGNLSSEEREGVDWVLSRPPVRNDSTQQGWSPTVEEIQLGHRLLPLVLGLAASGRIQPILQAGEISEQVLGDELLPGVVGLLRAGGCVDARGPGLTVLGRRVLERGPGPFGIVEAYHPYMSALGGILKQGRGAVHLTRGSNVAASQRANRASFSHANNALDEFCESTGWTYSVYIEHALGCGEATRQRFERSGDRLTYLGADLEDEAIDAAQQQQALGRLPPTMRFIRNADIGDAGAILEPLARCPGSRDGVVMVVGNGFHEIRDQGDAGMVAVLRAYCGAGIVLLFTEETALSIRDQKKTAWNTYHPAFRYVHEKSGQGLRPALDPLNPLGDDPMPMSWTECASRAGYLLLDAYTRRGRTIYPCPQESGRNPSTSVIYFFLPAVLAEELGVATGGVVPGV